MYTRVQNSSGMSQPKSDGLDMSALAESAKAKLGEIGAPVKDKAMEVASQQKDAGAEQLQTAGRAIHGAARELESSMPQIAGYVHDVGKQLENLASDIRSGSIDELMSKLSALSKDEPALVFGGAMLAGFALSRFLKSSAQNPSAAPMSGMQTGSPSMPSATGGTSMSQGGFSSFGSDNPQGPTGGIR
jgi:hypothetical protein